MRDLLRRIAAWDRRLSHAVARSRRPILTGPLAAASWSGSAGVWLAVAAALLFARYHGSALIPRQEDFLRAMLAALLALAAGGVLKRVVRRPRPFATDGGPTRAIWAPGPRHSFPSTHAATSVALATALVVDAHPLAPWLTLWALVTSWSRVYLGVHYPSDVAAGALLGVASGIAGVGSWW